MFSTWQPQEELDVIDKACPLCGTKCWVALYRVRGGALLWTYLERFTGADDLAEALAASPERTLHRVEVLPDGVNVVEDADDGRFLRHDCFRQDELPGV